MPKGKRRQELRSRFDNTGVPAKRIVLYELTDDEAVEASSSQAGSSDEENRGD